MSKLQHFQCMSCDVDFAVEHGAIANGMNAALAFPCRQRNCCICSDRYCGEDWCVDCNRLSRALTCVKGSCPNCGSLYVEWVSYPHDDAEVYTYEDWSRGRAYLGSISIEEDNDRVL